MSRDKGYSKDDLVLLKQSYYAWVSPILRVSVEFSLRLASDHDDNGEDRSRGNWYRSFTPVPQVGDTMHHKQSVVEENHT
jgi:hypothetical protein